MVVPWHGYPQPGQPPLMTVDSCPIWLGRAMVLDVTSPITLRAYSTDDQLAAIPVLLGFHPSSSLVLALIVDGCMGPLLRADLVDALRPEPLHRLLSSLENRVAPDCGLYIVVYGDDRDQLRRLALEVERKASLPVSESVIVCGGQWWHTYATDDDPGRPYCPQSSPVAAEAKSEGQH